VPRHPQWQTAVIAQRLGCRVNTGKRGRQRGQTPDAVHAAPRAGTPRTFPPLQPAPVSALACRAPCQHGQAWGRGSGEKLAQGAVEHQIGEALSPGTSRRWRRAEKRKPGRYHAWPPSTAPPFIEKAAPGRDLSGQAPVRQTPRARTVWADEKPSSQARPRVPATTAAAPGEGRPVADRYKRRGARPLFRALVVASGLTFAPTRAAKQLADCKAFLLAFFPSALGAGVHVRHRLLDKGPTHAPKQLGTWLAARELTFAGRLDWRPQ
jgi:hypothetical protein